ELLAYRCQTRERDSQNRGLRIDRILELFGRPLEAQLGQLEPEDLIGLLKDAARRARAFVQRLAHADVLRPLAREHIRQFLGVALGYLSSGDTHGWLLE